MFYECFFFFDSLHSLPVVDQTSSWWTPLLFSTTDSNISRLSALPGSFLGSRLFRGMPAENENLLSALSLPITKRWWWHSPGNPALVKLHDAHRHPTGLPSGAGGPLCGEVLFLRLASRVIAAFYIMNKYLWGLHKPCRCVIRSVLRAVYVRRTDVCLKKATSCIIHQPGERRCSCLISQHPLFLLPPCVLIVSANSGMFRQVRSKCGWCDLHLQRKIWMRKRK